LEPSLEPFSLNRVDPRSCFGEVGGRRIEGLPAFDGALADSAGVSGRLGAAADAPIALLDVPVNGPRRARIRRLDAPRPRGHHRGHPRPPARPRDDQRLIRGSFDRRPAL
jgi:hypothetical protein